MLFEIFHKFAQIRFYRNAFDPELARKLFRDPRLQKTLPQKFEDPRPHRIDTEHLPPDDVEDGRTVIAVCHANVVWNPQHVSLH